MKGLFPFLEKLFADSAYQGPIFADGIAKILPRLKTEIIKRSDQAKECLAKDWENLNRNALAFLKLASQWPNVARLVALQMPEPTS
jgi:putative transposase